MVRYFICVLFSFILLVSNLFAESIPFTHQGRSFKLAVPAKNGAKKPLLVLLHGCKQSAEIILKGTSLDEEALKRQFFLLVPDQSAARNSERCWNWFYSHEQLRSGINEMGYLVAAIENLARSYPIDRTRIYVAGLSAGGAMAHNLLACYPDYFSGVAIHSGLTFKTAENIYEAQTVLTASSQKHPEYLGSKAFACGKHTKNTSQLKKVLIIHGSDDKRVPSLHADLMSSTHQILSDLIDDGVINQSDSPLLNESTEVFENGYKAFTTERKFKTFVERKVLIQGLKHAWGAGKPLSENFDPKAPSSNKIILNFFNL